MSKPVYSAARQFTIYRSDQEEVLFSGNIQQCFEYLEEHPEYQVDGVLYYLDEIHVYLN